VLWRNDTALWFNGPNNEHGQFDYRNDLSKIECPALVMVGEEDPITPPEFSETIVENLHPDRTRYVKFKNCGHGVVGDRPSEALKTLRDFIETVVRETNGN
jgi:proline iminopeptidase